MATFKGVNFERYAILDSEDLAIAEGFAMVVGASVLLVDGYVWLNGLLRVN